MGNNQEKKKKKIIHKKSEQEREGQGLIRKRHGGNLGRGGGVDGSSPYLDGGLLLNRSSICQCLLNGAFSVSVSHCVL